MEEPTYRRPEKVLVYLYRRVTSCDDLSRGRPKRVEYLLLQRQPSRTNAGGIWQTVVGGVRWQEERVEAARREVFEETGLTLLRGIMAIGYAFSFPIRLRRNQESWYAPGVTTIVNTVYAGEAVSARPIRLCKEHIDYGWFSYADALRRLHWSEEREALSRLHPMIAVQAQRPPQPGMVQRA
jgi:8-oxo-dGTP pyrophosphatase MutT (NUDIX family)